MDQLGNEKVRRSGILREFAGQAEQNVLRWFGHMGRMEEDWLVKRIVISDMIRLRGRTQIKYMDGVKRMLNERGMSVVKEE